MRFPIRRLGPAVLPFLGLALASCGGGGSDPDVEKLLDRAFNRPIESADIKIDANVDLKGGRYGGPLRVRATGPFRNNDDKLPAADITIQLGGPLETGFVSTGDRIFFKFQDVFYEQPRSSVASANRDIARSAKQGGSLETLGLDPRRWLEEADQEDGETVAGVETDHVAGRLDVGAVMRDFNDFVKRSAGSLGETSLGIVPEPLTAREIETVEKVVDDPSFDVYVGRDDGLIRRLSGQVEFDVAENERDSVAGLSGGSVTFSIEFSDVNGDQRIKAPANARPLRDLTSALGDFGSSDDPGSSSESPSKRYTDCVDGIDPSDTDAIQRCSELLE